MDKKILETLGLSRNESAVYLSLLQLGVASVGQIAKIANVHRVNVYDILERLMKKGLVSTVIKSNKKYFESASPENIKFMLEEKEKEINEVRNSFPHLMEIYSNSKKRQEIYSFKGIQGIKTAMKSIIDERPKEILNFGSTGGLLKMSPINFDIWESQREKAKIPMRILVTKLIKDSVRERKYQRIKSLSEDFVSLSSTLIYDSKIAIFIWAEEPIAIIIESLEISDSYRNYFESLWKIAKS